MLDEYVMAGLGESVVLAGVDRISGVFDSAFIDALGVESVTPVFITRSETLDDLDTAHGDTLDRADGTRYLIRGIEPDGTGVTVLRLERQS